MAAFLTSVINNYWVLRIEIVLSDHFTSHITSILRQDLKKLEILFIPQWQPCFFVAQKSTWCSCTSLSWTWTICRHVVRRQTNSHCTTSCRRHKPGPTPRRRGGRRSGQDIRQEGSGEKGGRGRVESGAVADIWASIWSRNLSTLLGW